MGQCPAAADIDEFIHNPSDRPDVATHLRSCARCEELSRTLKEDLAFTRRTARLHREVLARPEIPGYRIIERLGEGGQAAVFKAIRETDEQEVALKIIPAVGHASAEDRERFLREIAVLSRCRHFRNIVKLLDHGRADDDPLWLVTECVCGLRVTDYAAGVDVARRVSTAVDVCRAIHFIHDLGFVYRDIKPANILVEPGGRVVVLDMGVVQVSDAVLHWPSERTLTGRFIGTLSYSSPEQTRAGSHGLDRRSDVYSLGVLTYQMLCGRLPYEIDAASPEAAINVIQSATPQPMGLEPRWAGVESAVARALAKDPEQRFESARELAQALERCVVAQGGDGAANLRRPAARRRRVWRIVLAITAATVALVYGLYYGVTSYYSRPVLLGKRGTAAYEAGAYRVLARQAFDRGDLAQAVAHSRRSYEIVLNALGADEDLTKNVRKELLSYLGGRAPAAIPASAPSSAPASAP